MQAPFLPIEELYDECDPEEMEALNYLLSVRQEALLIDQMMENMQELGNDATVNDESVLQLNSTDYGSVQMRSEFIQKLKLIKTNKKTHKLS